MLEISARAGQLRFVRPVFLWLLVPVTLLLLSTLWAMVRRRAQVRETLRERTVPVAVNFGVIGPFGFWVAVLLGTACAVLALAEPVRRTLVTESPSADFVLLLDGSASMYVRDVEPDRWQRSVAFIRTFAETLAWKRDRLALAVFAQLAAAQIRLTRDPTAFFFFIDHLGARSPFRLEDDPTWDTNIEEGVSWGLNMVRKDEDLFGRSPNAKVFIVISDGQAWSGTVANAVRRARDAHTRIHVVGVGTTAGDRIPRPEHSDPRSPPPDSPAVLDRTSLRSIASRGGGQYFELGTRPDRQIAEQIIASTSAGGGPDVFTGTQQPLYGQVLLAAVAFIAGATLFLREAGELRLQTAALLTIVVLVGVLAWH